ncbi:hypothetical protein ACJX0J_014117 [Zea mays]
MHVLSLTGWAHDTFMTQCALFRNSNAPIIFPFSLHAENEFSLEKCCSQTSPYMFLCEKELILVKVLYGFAKIPLQQIVRRQSEILSMTSGHVKLKIINSLICEKLRAIFVRLKYALQRAKAP